MNKEPIIIGHLKVVARRNTGVRLEAHINGENLAYAITPDEARSLAGALVQLAPGTDDDYFSITGKLTVICTPATGALPGDVSGWGRGTPAARRGRGRKDSC